MSAIQALYQLSYSPERRQTDSKRYALNRRVANRHAMTVRDYLIALLPLLAAVLSGFLVRLVGELEGNPPWVVGVRPVVTSAVLCLVLWVALWRATRWVYAPLRLALVALVPFLIGATAGAPWTAFGVVPGAGLAAVAITLAVVIRRD